MDSTLDSDTFLANLDANNPKTPTKQQKLPPAQLIMSSSDMLGSQIIMRPSQRTILKFKKRRAVASPDKLNEKLADLHKTSKTHQTDTTSAIASSEVEAIFPENHFKSLPNSDKQLQNARILLKQAMQQFSLPSVQKELENSIKALDQARKIANLVSLKQADETFLPQESPDVQQQLDSFKTEVNSKLDTILQTIKSTEKPAFVFGKPTNNTKNPNLSNQTNQKVTKPAKSATYASIASNQDKDKPWTTVARKIAKPATKTISYRDRRLVMKPKTIPTAINAIEMRNKINNALKTAKIDNLLVATVAISQSGASIVFTTSEGTAEDLLKHQHVWSLLFDFTEIKKDEKWYKIVAHGIPTAFFNIKEGMQLVKDEVETFNKDIKLAMLPHWLTSEEARQGKQHGSIVLTVKTNQEVQNALRNRLIIAGTSVRTAVYTTCKPTDQCRKCQKFGHLQTTCKNKDTCQFCAGNHNTREHGCFLCPTQQKGTTCAHIVYKCSNCGDKHAANSAECSVFKALQPISSTADPLAMETS